MRGKPVVAQHHSKRVGDVVEKLARVGYEIDGRPRVETQLAEPLALVLHGRAQDRIDSAAVSSRRGQPCHLIDVEPYFSTAGPPCS